MEDGLAHKWSPGSAHHCGSFCMVGLLLLSHIGLLTLQEKVSRSRKGGSQVSELSSNTIQYHVCSVLVKGSPKPGPIQMVKKASFISHLKEWQDPLGRAMDTEDIIYQRVLLRLPTCYGNPGLWAHLAQAGLKLSLLCLGLLNIHMCHHTQPTICIPLLNVCS